MEASQLALLLAIHMKSRPSSPFFDWASELISRDLAFLRRSGYLMEAAYELTLLGQARVRAALNGEAFSITQGAAR